MNVSFACRFALCFFSFSHHTFFVGLVSSSTAGERAVGYQIMKNRGLVPHQKKANKNPRVRKREQYRKAVIRRKGAVRDIRTGEAVTYGGEDTGIKTGISCSHKLALRQTIKRDDFELKSERTNSSNPSVLL